MNRLSVSDGIIPIGEFKTGLSKWIKKVQNTGTPLVITQNGRPAGVLISPFEYDDIVYKRTFYDSINRGVSDIEKGDIFSTKELKEELKKRKK